MFLNAKDLFINLFKSNLLCNCQSLRIERPAYFASSPSSSSILNNWLYLAVLSVLETEPVLICPDDVATTKSDIVVSSVSPDLWEIIHE